MEKKRKGFVLSVMCIIILTGTSAAEERSVDIGLGFFSEYNAVTDTLLIFASYSEWEFGIEGIGREQLERIIPGSLVEFTYYPGETRYIITDIINHAIPSPEEYQKIVDAYREKREKMLEGEAEAPQ